MDPAPRSTSPEGRPPLSPEYAPSLRAGSAQLERHLNGLRAYVRLRLGGAIRSRESSSDIAQSVCREALEDLGTLEARGDAGFRQWLFRRAERKIVDRGRFWNRERRSAAREIAPGARNGSQQGGDDRVELETLFTPSRHAVAREELERVERAFHQLPEDYRRAIALARIAGLSHDELARELGRTPSATRTLLSRALARLATLLEQK